MEVTVKIQEDHLKFLESIYTLRIKKNELYLNENSNLPTSAKFKIITAQTEIFKIKLNDLKNIK